MAFSIVIVFCMAIYNYFFDYSIHYPKELILFNLF